MITYKGSETERKLRLLYDFEPKIEMMAAKIENFLDRVIGMPSEYVRPEIQFSNETVISGKEYGDLSPFLVRDALVDLIDGNPDCNAKLKESVMRLKEAENKGSIIELMYEVRSAIMDIFENPDASKDEIDIARKAAGISERLALERDRLLGEYSQRNNRITIYLDEWDYPQSKHDNRRFFAHIGYILAHELFHAVHSVKSPLFSEYSDRAEVVREASADFSAFAYCLRLGDQESLDEAKNRYQAWRDGFLTRWPYAKALYYLRPKNKPFLVFKKSINATAYDELVSYGSMDKLQTVIELSCESMRKAYNALTNNRDAIAPIPYKKNRKNWAGNGADDGITVFRYEWKNGTLGWDAPTVGYEFVRRTHRLTEIHYDNNGKKARETYRVTIKASKGLTEKFFSTVEGIDWNKNYIKQVWDAGNWTVTLTYGNGQETTITGDILTPKHGERLTEILEDIYFQASYGGDPHIF